MDSRQALKSGINGANHLIDTYLGDLSDADLLVRAIPGTNHIAWQLGHLIQAENYMMEKVCPGSMPKLPEGFKQQHSIETAASDDPKAFLTKAQYLALFKEQRAATLAALAKMSDEDLDKPTPPPLDKMWKRAGDVFAMQGTHWVMHAGQWAIIRRKLGHKPLF
jgi:hypothetical protein